MISLRTVNGVKAALCNKVSDGEPEPKTEKSPKKKIKSFSPTKGSKGRLHKKLFPYSYKESNESRQRAPRNYGQFLMEEHDNLSDKDLYNLPLKRESSFSQDSDSEELIEKDEQFSSRQFWTEYNDVSAARLEDMGQSQLIQEYLTLEDTIQDLETQLREALREDSCRIREPSPVDGDDDSRLPGEVPVDAETAAKIEIFNAEIGKLSKENKILRKQNRALEKYISQSPSYHEYDSSFEDSETDESGFSDFSFDSSKMFSDDSNADSGVASVDGGMSSSSVEDFSKDFVK